jgi:ribosome modulation factor
MTLPPMFFSWNRAHRGAFLKGMHASLEGQPRDACPYQDKRKPSGRLSWSRSFIAAWSDGWDYATADRSDALITAEYVKGGR